MKTILVTGGAGSLGREIVDILIQNGHKVRAMDINEAALASLRYPESQFTAIYGDIRQYTRVHYAMVGCDYVIHCAAMKNLDITENNASELNRTNVAGTDNVAMAAKDLGLDCAILISTDKAVDPLSAYGASKLLAEKSWKSYGRQTTKTRFAIFRSGNFKQSAGNVLEVWRRQHDAGDSLTLTDPEMRRYFIDTRDAAAIVADMPGWALNGDIVIPKMRLWNMLELLQAEYPGASYQVTGSRHGEKLEERLMTEDEHVKMETDKVMVVA